MPGDLYDFTYLGALGDLVRTVATETDVVASGRCLMAVLSVLRDPQFCPIACVALSAHMAPFEVLPLNLQERRTDVFH
jgi:hypothetical protein